MNFNLTHISDIDGLKSKVENHSAAIESVVGDIIKPYSEDLDRYISFIKDCLKDGEKPPTDEELDDFCLNLSTLIYFSGSMCEYLGIREDISKAIYKEMYHSSRSKLDGGTVADKDSLAELASQQEALVSVCYTRAAKLMRSKVENAQELLSSCKKVLTRRMQEYNLTQQAGGK